jgi:hypothetical protein
VLIRVSAGEMGWKKFHKYTKLKKQKFTLFLKNGNILCRHPNDGQPVDPVGNDGRDLCANNSNTWEKMQFAERFSRQIIRKENQNVG